MFVDKSRQALSFSLFDHYEESLVSNIKDTMEGNMSTQKKKAAKKRKQLPGDEASPPNLPLKQPPRRGDTTWLPPNPTVDDERIIQRISVLQGKLGVKGDDQRLLCPACMNGWDKKCAWEDIDGETIQYYGRQYEKNGLSRRHIQMMLFQAWKLMDHRPTKNMDGVYWRFRRHQKMELPLCIQEKIVDQGIWSNDPRDQLSYHTAAAYKTP